MDKIVIQDLEIYAYHGVNPEENFLGQKFLISLELFGNFSFAGKTDELQYSINYAEVCKFVEELFLKENHKLIECCAERIAEALLIQFPLSEKVHILLKKPWAPIGSHLNYAGVDITRNRHRAYLGIGSNLGNKEENIQSALEELNTNTTKLTTVSTFYQTKPWGMLEQDDFLNCAVEISTLLTPTDLVRFLQSIEGKLKRERNIHWGPRTIDLDILLYDDIITDEREVVIPHPHMEKRLFVLTPLAEIAPWVVHPLLGKRIFELNETLKKTEIL